MEYSFTESTTHTGASVELLSEVTPGVNSVKRRDTKGIQWWNKLNDELPGRGLLREVINCWPRRVYRGNS